MQLTFSKGAKLRTPCQYQHTNIATRGLPLVLVGAAQLLENTEVLERRHITHNSGSGYELAKQSAHDLPTACLGETLGKPNVIRLGNLTDLLANMRT